MIEKGPAIGPESPLWQQVDQAYAGIDPKTGVAIYLTDIISVRGKILDAARAETTEAREGTDRDRIVAAERRQEELGDFLDNTKLELEHSLKLIKRRENRQARIDDLKKTGAILLSLVVGRHDTPVSYDDSPAETLSTAVENGGLTGS